MDWNGHKQLLAAVTRAFSDLIHNIIDMVAGGDKVAVRLTVTGTHKGEFQGIPPTGKRLYLDEMAFLTIMDGKITEGWITSDTMGLMQQIGAIPADASDNGGGSNSSTARS
jgi:predicted ester cyclase